ncbi:hypothetical protein ETB97_007137 [Aspergillus alliaceus]|uniref:Uncharacterized protein n=1 Tax=Petromyces alliaceus TaxID=209559 RepID=A0A8H5ZYE2_PETAA|nr:hypothetical protein ETB97_007137 [Aspergillus burnettii]
MPHRAAIIHKSYIPPIVMLQGDVLLPPKTLDRQKFPKSEKDTAVSYHLLYGDANSVSNTLHFLDVLNQSQLQLTMLRSAATTTRGTVLVSRVSR